jgi:hypothetical protein
VFSAKTAQLEETIYNVFFLKNYFYYQHIRSNKINLKLKYFKIMIKINLKLKYFKNIIKPQYKTVGKGIIRLSLFGASEFPYFCFAAWAS